MTLKLDQLEAKLQTLVESQLLSILPGLKNEDRIIQKLVVALRQNIINQKDTNIFAPNVFTLIVSPDSATMWGRPQIVDALLNIISSACKEVGLKFESPPTITITIDETYSPDEVAVVASHKLEPVEDTKGMTIGTENVSEPNDAVPDNAFLIIEGIKVHPLKEAVVNIGRRLENHLVIDDPRISRNHAQLRAIKGRFVLFDLNSTGGSFVNGQRTSQTVLYPGDVISLAGVSLIFGQDNPPTRPDLAGTETSPGNNIDRSERPTATLDKRSVEVKTERQKKVE